jgi:acetyltransferase-like isoleucine patch superfamily enzyme
MNLPGLIQRFRRWRLARFGIRVDRSCSLGGCISLGIFPHLLPAAAVRIGIQCEICHGVELNPWNGHIHIGRRVFIGPGSVIYGHGGVEIGEYTLIAMHCCIMSSNHTVPSARQLIRDQPDQLLPTRIGRDVWLGAGVKVLGGVTIGDGCVVGAGAVVTSDLPAYSIAVGVPARVTGHREP